MRPEHLELATALAHDATMAATAGDGAWMAELFTVGVAALVPLHQDLLLLAIAEEIGAAEPVLAQ
jgi:hypothetical protein